MEIKILSMINAFEFQTEWKVFAVILAWESLVRVTEVLSKRFVYPHYCYDMMQSFLISNKWLSGTTNCVVYIYDRHINMMWLTSRESCSITKSLVAEVGHHIPPSALYLNIDVLIYVTLMHILLLASWFPLVMVIPDMVLKDKWPGPRSPFEDTWRGFLSCFLFYYATSRLYTNAYTCNYNEHRCCWC